MLIPCTCKDEHGQPFYHASPDDFVRSMMKLYADVPMSENTIRRYAVSPEYHVHGFQLSNGRLKVSYCKPNRQLFGCMRERVL